MRERISPLSDLTRANKYIRVGTLRTHAPKAPTRKRATRKNGPRSMARALVNSLPAVLKSWRHFASFVFALQFEPVLIVSRAPTNRKRSTPTPKSNSRLLSPERPRPLIEDRCNLHSCTLQQSACRAHSLHLKALNPFACIYFLLTF